MRSAVTSPPVEGVSQTLQGIVPPLNTCTVRASAAKAKNP